MSDFDDLIRKQRALREAQRQDEADHLAPAAPPRLHGDGARLRGGFLFGIHVRQILDDYYRFDPRKIAGPGPRLLGDIVEAQRWLGQAPEAG